MNRVKIFKALSDVNRISIIESLQSSEKCGCTILEELNIVQSTLSHHMKILVECELVKSRKDGKWTYYVLNDIGCENAKKTLDTLVKKSDLYVSDCNCCD